METFRNQNGRHILLQMVKGIQDGKVYLGEIDGLIGDGDHGMNMNKGFSLFEKRLGERDISFSDGLQELGTILLNEIGGSMGPIYGTVFISFGEALEQSKKNVFDLDDLTSALATALEELRQIVDAAVGDKTLIDTFQPAVASLQEACRTKKHFSDALQDMKAAAAVGRDSTKDLVAKFGRSSRLGERSRGVLDAGACSCCILLQSMADGISALLLTGGEA